MKALAFFLLLMTTPCLSFAAVYKCEVNGQVSFSDAPCGQGSQRINVEAPPKSGMRLDRGTNIQTYQPPQRKEVKSRPDPCPYINSTELNTLIIREQVKTGMKPEHVKKSWGSPSSINTSSGGIRWAYHWPNGNSNYVYFKSGCVSDVSSYVKNY